MDLSLAIQVAQNRYLRERTQSCPEDRLELLRRFMDSAKDLQNQIQGGTGSGAAAGPVGMSPAQAGAAGLPPPVPPVIGAAGGAVPPPGPAPAMPVAA